MPDQELLPPRDELNDRQRLFVIEYLVDLSPRKAAIRAGYSKHSASVVGPQVLRNPKVAEAVDKALVQRAGITRTMLVNELGKVAMANMSDFLVIDKDGRPYIQLDKLEPEQMAAIKEITIEEPKPGCHKVRLQLHDKLGAIEKLARATRLMSDRQIVVTDETGTLGDTRDLARAILGILREAEIEEKNEAE